MNQKTLLRFMPILLFLVISGCRMQITYEKTEKGVRLIYPDATLRVDFVTPKIVHVFYTQADTISKKSLIISHDDAIDFDWSLDEEATDLVLKSENLTVRINKRSGEISYYKRDDNLILEEKKGGGKTMEKVTIQGEETWHVRQQFETDEDEAIYGLGQHQDRLMNIKGYEIDLFQQNIQTYVPFLVSSNNYGILWDNYSFTQFGSLEKNQPLAGDCLLNTNGERGGLTAEFFNDQYFQQKANVSEDVTRVAIPVELPENYADQILSARWNGKLIVPETGEYQFFNRGQMDFKMWIEGNQVTDYWASFLEERDEVRLSLESGKEYDITIEFWRENKDQKMNLTWRPPDMKEPYLSLWSKAGDGIDYYFVYGQNPDEIIAGYRLLTGEAIMLPKWAYGFWQCKERYKTQDEIIGIVKEFRKRKVPLDNIVLDWQYWKEDQWGSHEFYETRFPDPAGMMKNIHDLNARLMISVWPKFYLNTENFRELNNAGFMYPYNVKEKTEDWLGYPNAYYDAYNPGARKMYWDQLNKDIFSVGIDAWWLDATEPETQSNQTSEEMEERMNPNWFGTGAKYLNAYPLFACQAVFEGQRSVKPDQRVFILTRSAFAGQQKYAGTTWSGDVTAQWSVLKAQIPAGLNFCLSGLPYWTTDIGAFTVPYEGGNQNEEYRELFTRWYQFGTFCPLFRVHGTHTPREIWHFGGPGHPAYESQLMFNKLRYALMPYIYSIAHAVQFKHYTIMRPLVMDFPDDLRVFDIPDQYMFGPAFLVCPVTDYKARERNVYLPDCEGWYDFWTGKFYDGGQEIMANAPYEMMPLFVKAGSIIPFGPEIQYTTEKPANPITFWVYGGSNGHFTIYEDDGLTYNYDELAEFLTILVAYNDEQKNLVIHDQMGEYPGYLEKRKFQVVWVSKENPAGYDPVKKVEKEFTYSGSSIVIQK